MTAKATAMDGATRDATMGGATAERAVAAPAPGSLDWLRVLLVHAHPDDETILTGGTLATLVAGGAQVVNLTCTLGEEGEVIGDRWAGLVAAEADQLGGYRATELAAALAELGVPEPSFLGGAGRWRDSGMDGSPSQEHPRALTNPVPGRFAEQARQLADVVRAMRPHVVITYDPVGWYGHPDHIRCHELTHAALAAAAGTTVAGTPWLVPRLAWVVAPATAIEADARWQATAGAGPDAPPAPPAPLRAARLGELPGWPDEEITHVVSLDDAARRARVRAFACHATQVELYPSPEVAPPTHFALSNHILQPLVPHEYFVAMVPRAASGSASDAASGADADADAPAYVWQPEEAPLDPETLAPAARPEPLPQLWDGLEEFA